MYQDSIKAIIKTKLKQKVHEFAIFFTGVEGWFALSYVECLEKAKIGRVVFVYNGLDFNALNLSETKGNTVVMILGEVWANWGFSFLDIFYSSQCRHKVPRCPTVSVSHPRSTKNSP